MLPFFHSYFNVTAIEIIYISVTEQNTDHYENFTTNTKATKSDSPKVTSTLSNMMEYGLFNHNTK